MLDRRPTPVGSRRVDPDPSITSAVGRHHSLQTAIADLVDNSLDAAARHVLVRVLQRDERAAGLLVVDDGDGMDSAGIDDAMGYARRRDYEDTDLGHFGIGLKAASLSQADTLYVWSRRHGTPPVGRGLDRATLDDGPMVQSYSTQESGERFTAVEPGFDLTTGTIVEWRDVRGFLQSPDTDEQRYWLESALEDVRTHLGIVLHRILRRGAVDIRIDVLDEDAPEFGPGASRQVEPLDPFDYPASGAPGYPRDVTVDLPEGRSTVTAHIWPDAPGSPSWTLGGRDHLRTQGLYVYRNDRLLQSGGWNELTIAGRDLARARVRVDIDDALTAHLTINPEKTGVVMDAVLTSAWNAGTLGAEGCFADYLATARTGAQEARRRHPRPVEVAEPGRGLASAVAESMEENATWVAGTDPVDLRWRRLMDDEVFRVDRDQRTLWLNSRYRWALGGAGMRNDDAQVVKSLLHLLLGRHLTGLYAGPKEKRIEHAWHAVLLAAVQEDERRTPRSPRRHPTPLRDDMEDETP